MKDEDGLYYVVRDEDIVETDKNLNGISASFIRGDRDLLPKDYAFLHPNYLTSRIYNDEGERTGFVRVRFAGYPITWEKMEKVPGRKFGRIKVDPEDAEEYFRTIEEDYRKYLEDHERKKREGRYVIAAITRWKYEWGKRNSQREEFYVGRIEGDWFFSPDIDERKKRVSADRFRIFREISFEEQDQAREIIRRIREAEDNVDFLDHVGFRMEDKFRSGEEAIVLKVRLRKLLQDFTTEEQNKVKKRLTHLMEDLEELGKEPEKLKSQDS